MSKMYKSKQGLCVLSGKVKEIAADKTSVTVDYRQYDANTKKASIMSKVINNPPGVENLKVGQSVTAIGYDCGPNFQLVGNTLTHESAVFEMNDIAVVSGYIQSASLNDEKDQDGNVKTKMDGTPKKPHFDIKILVDDNGKETVHQIKNYNFVSKNDGKVVDNIADMAKRFERFESPEATPTYVTIVTSPGNAFSYEKSNGTCYYGCSHLGVRSLDQIFEYQLQKAQDAQQSYIKQEPTMPPAETKVEPKEDIKDIPFQTPVNSNVSEISGLDDDFDLAFE